MNHPLSHGAIEALRKAPLLSGIDSSEIESMLACLGAFERSYAKGERIFRRGEAIREVGIVVDGTVHIVMEDFWGNRNILGNIPCGQMFGEAYACMEGEPSRIDAVAAVGTRVVFLDLRRVTATCTSACDFHVRLVRNMLSMLARKNLALTQKAAHVAQRSMREKVLSYLSAEALSQGSSSFEIPFNRQQLADYLGVERSALSTTLGRLRDEGAIAFERNRFALL